MRSYNYTDAILLLRPEAVFSIHKNEYSTLNWLDEVQTKPTETEIQEKIAELETAEPMRLLREERNRRLVETDWRATVDYPGTDKEVWLTYRQALRDLPSTATPELNENGQLTNVTWPTKPE